MSVRDLWVNPFLPTGPFLAPKLIILINSLMHFLQLQSVALIVLYVEKDVKMLHSNQARSEK